MYVICNEIVTSRTYNVERHFEKLHSNFDFSTGKERREYFLDTKKRNQSQTSILKSFLIPKNNITAASFQVTKKHGKARHGTPLSEGKFLKTTFLECSASLFVDFKEKYLIIK